MSNRALNWAWSIDGLSTAEKLVLIRLADRANSEGRCFPGLDSLASDCGVHRTTIIRAVRKLERMNLLAVHRQGGRNKPNHYQLKLLHHATESEGAKGSKAHGKGSVTHKNGSTTHKNGSTTPPEPSVNPQKATHTEPDAVCVDDVIEIFNQALPELPTAKASEILADDELVGLLEWMIERNPKPRQWRDLFEEIKAVPSYMGENNIRWQADLPWLIRNMQRRVLKRINAPRPEQAHLPRYLP